MHDWPDAEAEKILERVVEAVEPGYSRVLLHEMAVMNDEGNAGKLVATDMDIVMLAVFNGAECTKT